MFLTTHAPTDTVNFEENFARFWRRNHRVCKSATRYLQVASDLEEKMEFVDSCFLMDSPLLITVIMVSYLLFVLKIGPNYMKNREPFKLQNLMLLYNAGQVLISCFLFYLTINMTWMYGLAPKTCIMNMDHIRKTMTTAMYYYLLAKISELLDTIFFVLRKKMNQVSFLHVYHHTLMAGITWVVLKTEPTYELVFVGLVNSFVHIIMYTYYGLSSFPSMTKYLWWKRYITIIQLVQFLMISIHFGVASMRSECSPSKIMTVAVAVNIILFLYLFGSFYVKNYNKKNDAMTGKSKSDNGYQNSVYHFDSEVKQNGDKYDSINRIVDTDTNSKSASVTLGQQYRIRINLNTKTPQIC